MSDHEDAAPELNPEDAPLEADEEKPEVAPAATAAEAGLGDDDDDDDDGPVVARRRERRGAVLEDESDDDDDEEDTAAKKKKRKAQALELDEDDYDLLEDNQVTGFRRPKEKKKRLQKAADREKGASGKEKQKPKTVRDVERDLFGDDDDDAPEADATEKPKPETAPVDEGDADLEASDSEDEFADFIEREEGEKPRRKLKSSMTGVRSEQLQDAVDIFGDLGELQELFARRNVRAADEGDDEEDEEEEEEDDFIAPEDGDEEAAAKPRRRRKGKRAAGLGGGLPAKWQSVFEPSIVREQMLTAADDAVRREDWPERLQLSPRPGGAPEDAQAVATWIFDRMMGVGSVRDLPTFGGDLLLNGWNDDESNEDHEARVRYREQTSGGMLPKEEADAVVAAIGDLLQMVHVEGSEMPYVAQHLKDRVAPLLRGRRDDSRPPPRDASGAVLERRVHRRDVLHEVMEWDERHARMTRRRKTMVAKIDAVSTLLERERADHPDLPVTAALANAAADAETDEALDDVDAKLALRFDEQLVALSEREAAAAAARGDAKAAERTLRPLNRTQYAHHVKKGLRDLLPLYGASPESLAERLVSYRGGEEESAVPDMSPEEAASVYVGPETGYETAEHVLKALTHVAAAEISAEPGVRAWLRGVVRRKACVWTQPTPAGTEAIDPFHPLAGVKRLQEKPVCDFDGSEFAATLKAHREGLIKLRIALPDRVVDEIVADAEAAYLLEQSTPLADAWNALRREAIKRGIRQHLVKALTREAAIAMEREARVHVRRECGEALWRRVAVAPWRPEVREDHADVGDASVDVRVLAAVWGPGDPPSTFAMLDADGELVDFLQCPNIATRAPKSGGAAVARQQADLDRLLKFMIEHRPHVVCVAASAAAGNNARLLKEAVAMVVGRIVEDHARAIPEEVDTIKVHFVDDVVPALAGQCAALRSEFVEHSHSVRHAVALGRYVRDPPGVIAQLASGGEARSMTLSPLQDCLTEEEKASVFQRALVDVVNQIGVDVNAAVAHPWRQFGLRYVCGLGPRKAGALVAAIRAGDGGAVESRAELLRVDSHGVNGDDDDDDGGAASRNPLGPVVFRNAAASLMIADADDALDATRVHPDEYARCLEIVANALEYDYEQLKVASASVRRKAFERAMDPENWDKLAVLDLRAYAEYLAQQGQGWTLQTLRETRVELRAPYGELREPWREHTPWEEFTLLTGETAHSLCPGKIVHATVKRLVPPRRDLDGSEIGTGHVVVALDSGVTGIVAKEDLSDRVVERLEHKVGVGQVIAGRVKPNGLDLEANAVHLSCKGSALSAEESARWELQAWQHKRYYSFTPLDGEKPKPKPRKKKQNENRGFIARNIDHPLFQNVSFQGAQKFLLGKDIGEVVLRPSSKGVAMLSMTLKFSNDSYVHYDIKEGAKPGVGHTANLALGSPLTLEGAEYEDLDEVYARHIEPMVKHIRAAHAHRKFRLGDKREVDLRLKAEMNRAPNTRPYAISVSKEHEGVFCLSAILSKTGNVHHEYFACKPEGFRFRRMEFPTVERMLSYFKVNPKPAPQAARPAAAPPQAPMGAAPAYAAQYDAYAQAPMGTYPPAQYGQPPPGYYGGAPPVQAYGGYYGGQTPMGAHGYPPQGPPPGQPPTQYQQRY
jgi:transcription elongation factor SPT6